MSYTTEFETLTLDNAHPALSRQFSRIVGDIADAFQDESGDLSSESRKASITIKLDLTYAVEDRQTVVECKVTGKLPAFRSSKQALKLAHGATSFLVEVDEAEQQDMFRESGVTPLEIQK